MEVPLANTATIGRSRDNTICLGKSALVSRQHAILRCHNGYDYQVIDLGSRNGTYVNGERVVMPITLKAGSVVRVGDTDFTFQIELSEDDLGETMMATMSSGNTHSGGPTHTDVALLVADIRGFSTVSESIAPPELAQFLGSWFREAGKAIEQSGGIIDKFLGDAFFAYWPRRTTIPRETEIALDVGRGLHDLACSMTWPVPAHRFEIVVVLHFGRVMFGNIGTMAQRDATVIGDAVNTIFRMEGVAKALKQPMLASEAFVRELPNPVNFSDHGEQELKGKAQKVRVFGCPLR